MKSVFSLLKIQLFHLVFCPSVFFFQTHRQTLSTDASNLQTNTQAKKTHQFKGERAICALILGYRFEIASRTRGWDEKFWKRKSIVYFNLMISLHMWLNPLLPFFILAHDLENLKINILSCHRALERIWRKIVVEKICQTKKGKKGKKKKLKHHDKKFPRASWCFIILDNYHHYWDHIN